LLEAHRPWPSGTGAFCFAANLELTFRTIVLRQLGARTNPIVPSHNPIVLWHNPH